MPGTTNIVLRPVRGTEPVVSIFNLGAPPEAGKELEKGLKAAEDRKWQDAEKHLTRAIEIHRDYPAAWHELGKVREAQGKPATARMSHRQAVEIDPQYLPPYVALARLDTKAGRWKDVVACTGFLLERSPRDYPLAWFYQCIAQYNLRDYAEAERSAREGIALRAHHEYPQLIHMLGLSLAHQRRFEEALRYLRQFVKMAPDAPDAAAAKQLIADIEQNRKR